MKKKIILSSLAGLSLTACTATQKANETYNKINNDVQKIQEAQELNNGSLYNIDKRGMYVDKTPIDTLSLDNKQNLPSIFNKRVVANDQTPKSKSELASFITKLTGVRVIIQQDIVDSVDQGQGQPDYAINEVIYTGSVKGLLDHVTSRLNLSWKYEGDTVEIYKYETKMFTLDALSGVNTITANLNTKSSSQSSSQAAGAESSAGAESGQETTINNTVNIWEQVGNAIQTVLSENEKVSLTPSAGKIVVMASPSHMRRVENILKEYNKFYSRLVRLDVKVYQVEANDEDSYGINWNSVWSKASSTLNVSMGGVAGASGAGVVRIGNTGGSSTGQAIFEALSTAGKISVLRNNSLITLNNQPVPLNVAREITYVQSTEVTTSGDNNTASSITPGVVTEGFAMNLTPLINDKGEILLQYSVDASTVEEIKTFTSADGKSSVELPRRSVSNFLQKVSMRNGESVVLTGFQEARGNNTDSGMGSASTWFLGGSRNSANKLKTIVVVVTPYILK